MGNSTANEASPREKGPTLLEHHQLSAHLPALGQPRRVDPRAAAGQRPRSAGAPDGGAPEGRRSGSRCVRTPTTLGVGQGLLLHGSAPGSVYVIRWAIRPTDDHGGNGMADRGQLERWAQEHGRAMPAVAPRYTGPDGPDGNPS